MTTIQPQKNGNHLNDALQIISDAAQLYPDSRNLARHHTELLAQCGEDQKALDACEAFLVRFGLDEELLTLSLRLLQHVGPHDLLAESGKHSISLCMIVKNEEKNLAACLASLKPVVDEMIVVDTGSTDRTVEVAAAFGARVDNYAWNGNFSDARNHALSKATGTWILVMDADEVLSQKDYEALHLAVCEGSTKKVIWNVLTRNYTDRHAYGWTANDGSYPFEERGGGWHPSRKVRLFPNDQHIRFSGEVHEMVESSAERIGYAIQEAPFIVHHYGGLVQQEDGPTAKQEEYFELGRKKLAETPNDLNAIGELAVLAAEMGRFTEAVGLWDRFLALQPDAIVALYNKGFALMGLQQYDEALVMADRALLIDPSHPEAAFNYGTCELYVGDPERAIPRLQQALSLRGNHPPILGLLTIMQLAVSKTDQACSTLAEIQAANYDISDYLRNRAATLEGVGRSQMARTLLEGGERLKIIKNVRNRGDV